MRGSGLLATLPANELPVQLLTLKQPSQFALNLIRVPLHPKKPPLEVGGGEQWAPRTSCTVPSHE